MWRYILLFPLTLFAGLGLEILLFRVFLKGKPNPALFALDSGYHVLALAALVLTLELALTISEALVLSLAFSLGVLVSFLILHAIRTRSWMEAVPYRLRGTPVLLISMGLLSLIFSAAAGFFLYILVN
jgi:electron transport complex protein RnfA